jgi:cytochrome c oxidase assembly protein subunit 15
MDLLKSPAAMRRWAVGSLLANMTLLVTGGLVRVTESGLGCSTWPQCEPGSYIPHPEAGANAIVEFGNRLLTFALIALAVGTFLAAWHARDDQGRPRRDLRRLAFVAAIGVPIQAVIGGFSVLTNLNPWVVSLHLLASVAMIVVCVRLIHRAVPVEPAVVPRRVGLLSSVVFAGGMAAVVLGTVVTGSGPNSGDGGAERNGFSPELTARIHSISVWLTLLALAGLLVLAHRIPVVFRAGTTVAVVSVLQGAIGYAQYFLGNPPALVAVHMLGTAVFTAAVAHLWLLAPPRSVAAG